MAIKVSDYEEHRDVPPEWEARLAAISPRTERATWLKLAWMSGIQYEPVGRFVIYEMVPLTMEDGTGKPIVPDFMLNALRGPDPRLLGEWTLDVDPETLEPDPAKKRWVSQSIVSRLQWQLFRETGCAPYLFWILQGANGGHRWRLPQAEKHFVTSLYGPGADVPVPGERPYAELTQRTLDQIQRHDRLRAWEKERFRPFGSLNKTEAGLYVATSVYDREKEYAAVRLKYLTDQMEDGVSNLSDADVRRIMDRAERREGDTLVSDGEAAQERWLTQTTHAPLPEE